MRKGCNQTSRSAKANRLKGPIRVQLGQLGCNQGAKGCNPKKPAKNTQKRAQLGEPVSTRGWVSQYRAQAEGSVLVMIRLGP